MATPNPNVTLASFLVDLSLDPNMRRRFDREPKKVLDEVVPALDKLSKEVMLAQNRSAIMQVLVFNQQSTDSTGVVAANRLRTNANGARTSKAAKAAGAPKATRARKSDTKKGDK
jgi:hypothetical protein